MNAYNPTRPLLRVAFAAVALAATLVTATFVDALAHSYSVDGLQAAAARPVVVAAANR